MALYARLRPRRPWLRREPGRPGRDSSCSYAKILFESVLVPEGLKEIGQARAKFERLRDHPNKPVYQRARRSPTLTPDSGSLLAGTPLRGNPGLSAGGGPLR